MCNANEHKPTPLERKTIKTGYKIFRKPSFLHNYLSSYWCSYSFEKGKWNTAYGIGIFDGDAGFHLFLRRKDAEAVVKHRSDENVMVVKKVQIKGLIAIGDAEGFDGDYLVKKQTAIRCKMLKIIED